MLIAGRQSAPRREMAGATLVEALTAIALLGVAMLGVSVLQISATASSRDAAYRFAAIRLAADLAERIRANPVAGHGWSGDPAQHDCINQSRDCSPEELAAEELDVWQGEIRRTLPDGATGHVGVEHDEAGKHYTIHLNWNGGRESGPVSHVHRFFLQETGA